MAGLRPDPVGAQRLANVARSGGARGAGGLLPASPRVESQTSRTPGRIVTPGEKPPETGSAYVPIFTVAGPIAVRDYYTPLYNVTGADLTVTRVSAALGDFPTGSPATVRLYIGVAVVATLVIAAGTAITTLTGLSIPWVMGDDMFVGVTTIGASNGGGDLVVQVFTA